MTVWNLQFSPTISFSLSMALTLLAGALFRLRVFLHKTKYPPGPPEANLMSGNASIVPMTQPWITYVEWANEYGSILHYRTYNQHIIILSSIDDCVELLEKRSGLYSDRPQLAMVDLMGWDFSAAMMPYGARWRGQRRLLQQAFKRDAILAYRPNQTRKVNDFLLGLLTSPGEFREHIKTVTAAIIMSTVYDYDVSPKGDYFVTLAEDVVARLSQSYFPGALAVNAVPILRFLPSWFPGAGFQKFAADTKELTRQMKEVPLKHVEGQIASGKVSKCAAAQCLHKSKSDQDYIALQNFASVSYAGGADTSTAVLGTFFAAMALSPAIQNQAQHELDVVVGNDRLPDYNDRSSLPFVEAVYREVLRWKPIFPLGVSHAVVENDVYKGYLIPRGATVITNIWAIAHNPDLYESPELFNPNRFMNSNGDLNDDNVEYTFGFGRRICPGRHMASDTIWLAIATVLSTFVIQKKKDASGKEIPIALEYTDGLVSHPLPYECTIFPRSNEAKHVIMEAVSQTSEGKKS